MLSNNPGNFEITKSKPKKEKKIIKGSQKINKKLNTK